MRIAVVGAGGVGGLLAAALSRAGRDEVVLVARGDALAAASGPGLAVEGPGGAFTARPALAVEDPAEATASMQRDLAAGRPSELDDQPGAIVRAARLAGVAVPLHEALLAALLPQERAARSLGPAFERT